MVLRRNAGGDDTDNITTESEQLTEDSVNNFNGFEGIKQNGLVQLSQR